MNFGFNLNSQTVKCVLEDEGEHLRSTYMENNSKRL